MDNRGYKPIGSLCHFAFKRGPSGETLNYKARLVAKVLRQVPGRDYSKVYSATACLSTIKIILSYALCKDSEPKQLDIKSAYLKADIDDEIFMKQPEDFEKKTLKKVYFDKNDLVRHGT